MEQFGSQLGMSSYHTVFLSFLLLLGLFTGSEAFFGCFWFTCCVQCPTTTVPTVVPTVAPGVGPCINNQCPSGFACVNGQCLSAPNVCEFFSIDIFQLPHFRFKRKKVI
ncbi:hypothetical protein Tcan_00344 [Toxocara canis]|uniref:CC domain-containing protein n=1 Tax=Toxocara canis TaxID=6265 RepID=A0A0B2UPK8_TOXCA|nr:hypothetical protein Tcan_00344 [Toxocara canis]